MADITTLTVNGDIVNIKDAEARNLISGILESKQDKISVVAPLSLNKDLSLSVDVSSFVTSDAIDEVKDNITTVSNEKTQEINSLQTKVVEALNTLTGGTINDDLTTSDDTPNYNTLISSINNNKANIEVNKTNISTLSEKIDENASNIKKEDTKIEELQTRAAWVEKEIFGSVYSDNTDTSANSNSRIDNLERLVNLLVGACLKRNIIMSEDDSLKSYNANANTYDIKEINETNYSY